LKKYLPFYRWSRYYIARKTKGRFSNNPTSNNRSEARSQPPQYFLSNTTDRSNPSYNIDVGWKYTSRKNGLTYGWNRLKVKDAKREGFDPVHRSYINTTKGDWWKMLLPGSARNCILETSGNGILMINGKKHSIKGSKTNIKFSSSGNILLNIVSGEINFYELLITIENK
jgi:hypothetical protein